MMEEEEMEREFRRVETVQSGRDPEYDRSGRTDVEYKAQVLVGRRIGPCSKDGCDER